MKIDLLLTSAVLAGAIVSTAQAQVMTEDQAMERGREVIALWWDADGEALWNAMTPEFQQQLGSIEPLLASRDDLVEQFGGETEVVDERVVPLGENLAYWRIIELDAGPEAFVLHLIIRPDGLVALGRGGFESEIGWPPTAK